MTIQALHGKQIIGGETSSSGEVTFQAHNPQTGQELPTAFCEATSEEADRAMRLAADCALELGRTTAAQRASLLRAIADEIEALGDGLLECAQAESGLPPERLAGERGRTVNQARLFADLVEEGSWVDARIDTAQPDRQPIPKPDVRKMLRPIGPVVVFGASNFPLAISMAGSDTVSALGAGCPVVVKAHPGHPGTSELVAGAITRALAKVGLPAGAFSMLHGQSHEIGQYLVRHAEARAVAFTGSLAGGKALFDTANDRPEPIPVYAEMGSVNPMFLMPQALADHPEQIASQYVLSLNMGVGQFCTNPGVVLAVEGPGFDAFVAAVAEGVRQTQPATMLHAGIRQGYEQGVARMAGADGVNEVSCSADAADPGQTQVGSHFFEVESARFLENPELQDEVFGPCGLLVRCASLDEFTKVAELMAGSLTATVHAQEGELESDSKLLGLLEQKAGRVILNGIPTGIEVCSAMHHGGPYPSTTHAGFTSIGTDSILRFVKPVSFQSWSDGLLPAELQNANPLGIWRLVDNQRTQAGVSQG